MADTARPKRRTEPRSRAVLFPLVLALAAAGCGDGTPARAGSSGPVLAAPADSPQVFGQLPELTLTDQAGAPVGRADLLGHPTAIAAIFTRCAGPCPRITGTMRRLQEALAGTDVRLVSVTVDPEYDTPEVLADYAQSYTADPARWRFLTGGEAEVDAFLKDGLWLALDRAKGEPDPNRRLTHSQLVCVVDEDGALRGWYDGTTQGDELEARLRHLASE